MCVCVIMCYLCAFLAFSRRLASPTPALALSTPRLNARRPVLVILSHCINSRLCRSMACVLCVCERGSGCLCMCVMCVCVHRGYCFQGFTPVNSAAYNGHVECIRALAELKADVNTPDNNGIALRDHPRVILIPSSFLIMYNLNSHTFSRWYVMLIILIGQILINIYYCTNVAHCSNTSTNVTNIIIHVFALLPHVSLQQQKAGFVLFVTKTKLF